ncbi:head maturation protease, ClpP-related [Streptomyces mirabilis]|uniref:head maturation protease, ClpP-related n=1 Tax=Streptomyces mirabilis TaxID=68239 RepID=UPI0033E423F6
MSRMPGLALPAKLTSIAAKQREQAEAFRAQHGVDARTWYRITNAVAPDEAEVMLYDEIGGWFGATADAFIEELNEVTAPNLRVRINSPGGSVFEGIAIANALRSHPANVVVQVDGIAASIASVIAMAGDRVEMAPNTMLMIHDASGLCMGDASDMEEMAQLLDLISDNIADAYAARAGGTRDDWRTQMRAETWYLPEDAVTAGLADEATQTPKRGTPPAEPEPAPGEDEPEPEMRRSFDFAAYGYTGPQQPETPKPAPSAAQPPAEGQPQLVISIADILDEETVAKLRAAVREHGAEEAVAEAGGTVTEVVDTASPVHHTATEDRPWDAGPNEKRLPSPMTVKTAKAAYVWYDEAQADNGELPKTACKLPHHEVSADGTPGAANLNGVRNALSRLPQSDIPTSQHDAVRRHLQAHLDDAKGADNAASVEPTAEWRGEHGPELVPLASAEPDAWADLVAHLTEPDPDPWVALVSHLTDHTASSSAATEAA